MSEQSAYALKLSSLDPLDLPLLVLTSDFTPVFLSSSAARILGVRNRTQLREYSSVLAPLVELARSQRSTVEKVSMLGEAAVSSTLAQVVLQTTDGRKVPVFAYPRALPLQELGRPEDEGGFQNAQVVVFHTVSAFEPFLQIIEQGRKTRVLAITSLTQSIPNGTESETSDLAAVITSAVSIIDQLIVSSIKVITDLKTSALLRVEPAALRRLICHFLLESADFAGPGGLIKVRAVLDPAEQRLPRDKSVENRYAELVVLAERSSVLRHHISPLEQYLHGVCVPQSYRIGVRENASSKRPAKELPLYGFLSKEQLVASQQLGSEVSAETLSDNLRAAAKLAERQGILFSVKPIRGDTIALFAQLRLSQ